MISNALIKQQLSDYQFAWLSSDPGPFTHFEIEIMRPVIEWARDGKDFSANAVILGPASCHSETVDDSEISKERWTDNYRKWYDAGRRIGQFRFEYGDFAQHLALKYEGWYRIYGLPVEFGYGDGMFWIDTQSQA